jgi:hypothetical protein
MNTITLQVEISAERKLSERRRRRWREIVRRVESPIDAAKIIFLGELLEVLDPAGKPCQFRCSEYSGPDIFESMDVAWSLATQRLTIYRRVKQEISEGWQRVEVELNETSLTGFEGRVRLLWDGDYHGVMPMKVVLTGIDPETAEQIVKLARRLFHQVRAK